MFSEQAEQRLQQVIGRYPQRRSALLPALYIAQEELGWISDEAVRWVADRIGVPLVDVLEVASFYTMFYKQPVGRYHVQMCRTLSCALRGSKEIRAYLEDRLGVAPGVITEDGMWSYEEVECLGSCGTGPVVQINDVFFEAMDVAQLALTMDRIERERPDLRYSAIEETLGEGLPDHPRSQVCSLAATEGSE